MYGKNKKKTCITNIKISTRPASKTASQDRVTSGMIVPCVGSVKMFQSYKYIVFLKHHKTSLVFNSLKTGNLVKLDTDTES